MFWKKRTDNSAVWPVLLKLLETMKVSLATLEKEVDLLKDRYKTLAIRVGKIKGEDIEEGKKTQSRPSEGYSDPFDEIRRIFK
jgi:hypothetical protein